jgi:hypothetical protein
MNDISKRLEQILLNMSYNPKITRQENEKIILERHKRYLINEETECERWSRLKNKPLDNNIGTIQDYLIALGFKITKDWTLGNPTATAIWTHLFGKPDTQKTSLQLWQKLKDKGYRVGNTPGCGGTCQGEIAKRMYEIRNNKLKACGGIANVDYGTIKHLASLGLDGSGGNSNNQAMALAALRITKTATDRIQRQIGGGDFQKYGVCVKIVGSTCAPGTFKTYNYFDMAMAEDINSLQNQTFNGKTFKPPQYCFLQNFYFDYGKIIKPVQDATSPTAPHNNWMFPDGVWNWFTTYWETDNANEILGKIASLTTGISSQSFNASDNNEYGEPRYTMWSTEFLHDIFTVAELGTLAAGFAFPPAAPLLFGVSSIFGAADAATYFAEGDTYMGAMMLGLEVIPGGELIKIFKSKKLAVQVIEEYGEAGTKNLLEKGLKKELKTAKEIADFNKLVKQKDQIVPEIVQEVQKQAEKNVSTNIGKNYMQMVNKGQGMYGQFTDHVKLWFDAIYTLYKASGMSAAFNNALSKMTVSVGGTMWGIDQLYLALYGKTEDRQKSDIRKLYYLIQGQGLPEEQELANKLDELPKGTVEEQAKRMMEVKRLDESQVSEGTYKVMTSSYNRNVKQKRQGYAGSGKEVVIPTPSLKDILNGTRKFSYGMESDDLLNIKRKLKTNYGASLSTKINETIQNNKFDDALIDVITDFQTRIVKDFYNVELNEKGIIGLETYNAIDNNPLKKMELKPIDLSVLEKDQYDYFSWNPRLQNWDPITYETYKEKVSIGSKVEKRRKQQDLQGLDKPDQTADMSKRKKKKYDKEYEKMKQYYDQLMLMKSLTPEQKKFLSDFDNYYNA